MYYSDSLPPPHEDFDHKKGIKTVTEYKINDNGKKVRVCNTTITAFVPVK